MSKPILLHSYKNAKQKEGIFYKHHMGIYRTHTLHQNNFHKLKFSTHFLKNFTCFPKKLHFADFHIFGY